MTFATTESCRFYRKLIEDEPGYHVFIHSCRTCGIELGPEWFERHWGSSDPVPDVKQFERACPLRLREAA